MEFQVGDKVEVLENNASGCDYKKGHIGVILEIHNSGTGCRVGPLESVNCVSFDFLKLISRKGEGMSKYDELKARIEKVEGWTKEADDILQEIYKSLPTNIGNKLTNNICLLVKINSVNEYMQFTSRSINDSSETSISPLFRYSSQCSKNTAFKQALMWLLENSSIKKDGLVGKLFYDRWTRKIFEIREEEGDNIICGLDTEFLDDARTVIPSCNKTHIKARLTHCSEIQHPEIMSELSKHNLGWKVKDDKYDKIAELERKLQELTAEIEKLRGEV